MQYCFSCLFIIYSLNGYEKPNRNEQDIIGINTSKANSGVVQVGKYQILDLGENYSTLSCTESLANGQNKDYCGDTPSGLAHDYWAGARKACADKEMRLPTYIELQDMGINNNEKKTFFEHEQGLLELYQEKLHKYLLLDEHIDVIIVCLMVALN